MINEACRALIVQGCKTDHGGVVLQGHPTISVNGIGMAAKGYMVVCPKCKGVFSYFGMSR